MITAAEFLKKILAGRDPDTLESGYCDCACPECMESPIVGEAGFTFCDDCKDAGCDDQVLKDETLESLCEIHCLVERCLCGSVIGSDDCTCAEEDYEL